MSSVAIIGACLVPCFIGAANPLFYTTRCGQNGCPMCHKAAQRGRQNVAVSTIELENQARHVAAEIPTRAMGMFSRQDLAEEKEQKPQKKSWFGRGCGWEEKHAEAHVGQQEGAAEMQETTRDNVANSQSRSSTGVAPRSEPYTGTPPMRIPRMDVQGQEESPTPTTGEAGASFGVDVSHLAPEPLPFGATPEERLIKENAKPNKSERGNQVRPSLDEAISWDRLAQTSKPGSKRKWWQMP